MIGRCVCDKRFIWNFNNCECDKTYDIGEYSDYSNCNYRKKLFDKLIEECNKNTDEVEITEITQAKNECSSCTLYNVLFLIFFTISIGIGTYFVYFCWYFKKDDARVMFDTHTETTIYWPYKWDKSKN